MVWKLVIVAMFANWQSTSEHGQFEARDDCLQAVEVLLTPQNEYTSRGQFAVDLSGWGTVKASLAATCVPVPAPPQTPEHPND